MKTKKLALAVVSMILFSAFYFSSCSSDLSAPDAASTISKIKGATALNDSTLLNDSLVADSLHHHGKKPHCDSTFVKHPKPALDSTFVKPPKPHRDSTFVRPPKPTLDSVIVKHPKPVFDSLRTDSVKSHRPNTFKPKGRK
ncbi:MAG: hypothetical protein WCJ61_13600 [Paludibacter sp.]